MKNTKQLFALSLLLIALMVGGGLLFSRTRIKLRAPIQSSGPALYAASYRETAGALSLIKNGAPINFVNPQFGDTPLHQAASGGNDSIVTALLAHGAKIEATNKYASTPLAHAARSGQLSTVKLLLSKGANPQPHNKFGLTPLQDTQSFIRFRRLSPHEKMDYSQIVAILSAVARSEKPAPVRGRV